MEIGAGIEAEVQPWTEAVRGAGPVGSVTSMVVADSFQMYPAIAYTLRNGSSHTSSFTLTLSTREAESSWAKPLTEEGVAPLRPTRTSVMSIARSRW